MLTVHHLENSRSQRILWLLEELGVPYELIVYPRDPATMLAPPALRAIHPLGKSPVITDGALTIAESGAIVEYLIETYAPAWGTEPADALAGLPPPGSAERLAYRYWLHYAEGTLMPLLVMTLLFSAIPRQRMPFFVKPIARALCGKVQETFLDPRLLENLDLLEASLADRPWLAGPHLTGADAQMSFAVLALLGRCPPGRDVPRLRAYLARIEARPAYRRALERGGPLNLIG